MIVVDDASTDDTWQTIQSFGSRVRGVRLEENLWQCGARNAGLALAEGEYVKFLDSDDLLIASHLDEELALARASGAGIVVSGWILRAEDGSERETPAPVFDSIVDDLLAGLAVQIAAALYRRREAVWWDEGLLGTDDWDYFVSAALTVDQIQSARGPAFIARRHSGKHVSSNVPAGTTSLARNQILRKLEERIAEDGRLTPARRRRLAQYYYKGLRVLSIHEPAAFESTMNHILELDPRFHPVDEEPSRLMRLAARLLGTRRAVRFYASAKRFAARRRRG